MRHYIAIPHMLPASEWFKTEEELSDDDNYIAGDHDLNRIIVTDSKSELEKLLSYKGHQAGCVHVIVAKILKRDYNN